MNSIDKVKSLFKIDHSSKLPLYSQIERNLKDLITRGDLSDGQMIPSEWELAALYGVSRLTARRAIDELVRQNWLYRRHGVGTFVKQPFRATIAASKLSFTEQMKAIGRRPSSRVLSCRLIPAPPIIAQRLQIAEGEPLVEIARLRLADETPILYEIARLPSRKFPSLEMHTWGAEDSLYRLLHERYGVIVTGLDHTIKPVLLSPKEAAYFKTEPGLPALVSEITAFAQDGAPVEYSWSVSNGDKGEFYFRFRQVETGAS
jgi:GntR family transcriptional regulator